MLVLSPPTGRDSFFIDKNRFPIIIIIFKRTSQMNVECDVFLITKPFVVVLYVDTDLYLRKENLLKLAIVR